MHHIRLGSPIDRWQRRSKDSELPLANDRSPILHAGVAVETKADFVGNDIAVAAVAAELVDCNIGSDVGDRKSYSTGNGEIEDDFVARPGLESNEDLKDLLPNSRADLCWKKKGVEMQNRCTAFEADTRVSAVVDRIDFAVEEYELDLGNDRRMARNFHRCPSCHRRTFLDDENDSTLFAVRNLWCPVLSSFSTSHSSHRRQSKH